MVEIKEVKALLSKIIAQLENTVPYADASYTELTSRSISKDKTGIENSSDGHAGVKIRAYDGIQYHETCIQGWQPALITQEAQKLHAKLKANPVAKPYIPKIDKEQLDSDFATKPLIDPKNISIQEKATVITEIHNKALAMSKDLINCKVNYHEEDEFKVFCNRNKKLSSRWTGCNISILPFIRTADGTTRYDYQAYFANGFEVKNIPQDELKTFFDRVAKIKSAKRITPGKYTAVFSPNVTGILAHESFGHGMESDTIAKGRAKAEEYLGKRIAASSINICDDPSIVGAHGSIFFDDEGQMPRKVFLVKNGIVSEPITESLSAWQRGWQRSCNGRYENFDHKIYARMTNTFFAQGKDEVKAMIKKVKNGLYLHHSGAGMEDPKGWGVQISGILAEKILNGKLTGELFYEISMTGYLPTILSNIQGIGNDFSIKNDAGFCGKGHKEWVRVSSGGPTLLIKEVEFS